MPAVQTTVYPLPTSTPAMGSLSSAEESNLVLVALAAFALLLMSLAIPIVLHFWSVNRHWKTKEYHCTCTWIWDLDHELTALAASPVSSVPKSGLPSTQKSAPSSTQEPDPTSQGTSSPSCNTDQGVPDSRQNISLQPNRALPNKPENKDETGGEPIRDDCKHALSRYIYSPLTLVSGPC